MDGELVALRKKVYIFEHRDNTTTETVVSITAPKPVDDENGEHYCFVVFERKLSSPRKLIGADAFQTMIIAIRFLEKLLSAAHADFEIRNVDGKRYQTAFDM